MRGAAQGEARAGKRPPAGGGWGPNARADSDFTFVVFFAPLFWKLAFS
jgi:hypothetical protein